MIGSLAGHGLILLWLADVGADQPPPRALVLTEVELVDPVDLELRSPPLVRPAAPLPPATAPSPPVTAKLPSPSSERSQRDQLPATTPPAPGGGALSMRTSSSGVGEIALGPGEGAERTGVQSPAEVARLIEPEPPATSRSPLELPPGPLRPPPSELVPDGAGNYRGEDLTFVARVSRDGRVQFEDRPNFHIHLELPSRNQIVKGIEAWYEGPYGKSGEQQNGVPIAGGGFDLTDWAMRESGQDPYYNRKHDFLERTRELRAELAAKEDRENLRDSLATLPELLVEIWSYRNWPARQRRQILFQLWDECAETGSREVVTTADAIRATIIAFIRDRIGPDSPAGYTSDELEELNRGRSSLQRFEPYQ